MTLDQIIKLAQECEQGVDGQKISYDLHFGLAQAVALDWSTHSKHGGKNYTFSEFLRRLQLHEPYGTT